MSAENEFKTNMKIEVKITPLLLKRCVIQEKKTLGACYDGIVGR